MREPVASFSSEVLSASWLANRNKLCHRVEGASLLHVNPVRVPLFDDRVEKRLRPPRGLYGVPAAPVPKETSLSQGRVKTLAQGCAKSEEHEKVQQHEEYRGHATAIPSKRPRGEGHGVTLG